MQSSSTRLGRRSRCSPYDRALANRFRPEWAASDLRTPAFLGRRVLDDIALEDVIPFIDWTFFFSAWEIRGRYPGVLDHPTYGEQARQLFDDGAVRCFGASSTSGP